MYDIFFFVHVKMLSTLKYQLFPSVAPGLIAGGVLATYDIFLGNASNKLQAVYDGFLLASQHGFSVNL